MVSYQYFVNYFSLYFESLVYIRVNYFILLTLRNLLINYADSPYIKILIKLTN